MALRIRRGTEAQRSGNTSFALGEIVWTTDDQQLWVGTGTGQPGNSCVPVVGSNVAGYGLTYNNISRKLEVSGLTTDDVTQGTNNKYFSTELAVDAVGAALVAGNSTNVGITFTYSQTQDDAGRINATVALDGVGITNIVDDTNPQLGGDLDLNSNDITGTGNINITGNVDLVGNIDTVTDITLSGQLSNGDLVIATDTIYSPTFADNPQLRLDTNFNLLGRTVNTGAGNETTATFNIFASSATGSKVLEDGPVYGQVIKAHNGTAFVDSAAFAFLTNGTITTGASSIPMSLTVLLGDGTNDIGSSAGQFSFNNTGSFVAPVLQTGVYTTTPSDSRPTGVKGMIIFNDTTGKFQGHDGTAWVDLN